MSINNKMNYNYNKTISMTPIIKLKKIKDEEEEKDDFDLCFYTYNGKLTKIIEAFNRKSEKENNDLVLNSFSKDKRNPLQISAFLNFSNIFLYLLTYNADSGKTDSFLQNTWHILAYRGHTKITGILLNHIRYELKKKSLKAIDEIKKQHGFSNLDLVKGKLSKAVPLTEDKVSKFRRLQNETRE